MIFADAKKKKQSVHLNMKLKYMYVQCFHREKKNCPIIIRYS